MALTLEVEQKLEAVGLVELFEADEDRWTDVARQTRVFLRNNFPGNAVIRRDDVAKAMVPILEVNQVLTDYLNENKIRGKHWIRDFADLIVDRAWDGLQ